MTIREEAQWCIKNDGILAEIRKKLRRGKATYADTAAYSARAGKMIGALLSRRLSEIPPEEREALCVELLHDQYIDINAAVDAAQLAMDELSGIKIAPQHAPFNDERAHQIGSSLRDLSKPLTTLQRRAGAATETATKAIHDDRMKAEADFRSHAGFKCYLNRTAVGGCCPWCSTVAGRYVYGDHPDDIFRRHDNCDCTVTFENGRQRQDVWSKRTWEAPEEGAGAGELNSVTAEQAAQKQAEMELHVLTNNTKSGTIKENGIYRRTTNSGAFGHLSERMSKKHIRDLANKYEIDLSGISIGIDANEELLRFPIAGEAVPEHIGKITFFPNAFKSEEELVRTLFHEKVHVQQFKKYGAEYVQNHRREFEDEAERLEELFIQEARKKGLL